MKNFVLAVLCHWCIHLFSQSESFYSGSVLARTLGYQSTQFIGLDAIYQNPAGLSVGKPSTGIDIGAAQMNGVNHLIHPSIGIFHLKHKNAFGIHLSRLGNAEYAVTEGGLVYSRQLHPQLWAGMRFRVKNLHIQGYGSNLWPGIDLGLRCKINQSSSWAIYISKYVIGKESALLKDQSRIAIGYQYTVNPKVQLLTEIEKYQHRNINLKLGWLYQPVANFEIRAGTELFRKIMAVGFGWNYKEQKLIVGYEWHPSLGGAYSMSVQWQKIKKADKSPPLLQ